MRAVISNLPEGAAFWWIEEEMKRMLGNEIVIEQVA